MGVLPYWDRALELEVASWVPYGLDYGPVSALSLYGKDLQSIAISALELNSELLCIHSPSSGDGGLLFRDRLVDPAKSRSIVFGFLMIFSFSQEMEKALQRITQDVDDVEVGLLLCSIWDREMLVDECKTIAIVSSNPFFDEESFFEVLEDTLLEARKGDRGVLTYYAEKFGYRRFSIPYETENVTQMFISQILFDFEFEETRRVVGPSPELSFPPLLLF
ncbi:MAG: hypothetical protein XD68_0873 [Synergistales bacterium 54_24]|nr:MAG: hypothetical protein XD68_0873 [Synergistales bacterium 54_24]HAF50313.1 hypothetical protein [Synergistaceae bacterium]